MNPAQSQNRTFALWRDRRVWFPLLQLWLVLWCLPLQTTRAEAPETPAASPSAITAGGNDTVTTSGSQSSPTPAATAVLTSTTLPADSKTKTSDNTLARPPSTPIQLKRPDAVRVIRLDGGIFAGSADYIIKNVQAAEADGMPVVLVLDTPGGALEATRDIVAAFLGARVPVLVYVGPAGARAGSAGVFLTLASNVAGMAPGTNIGAAHPVGLGVGAPAQEEEATPGAAPAGGRSEQEVMAQKVENDTLAFIESIANSRGRNVEWALSAVKESASITAEKALELNVIDLLARDLDGFLKAADGRVVQTAAGQVTLSTATATQLESPMSARQKFLSFLSDPNLVYILFAIGMMCLYLELSSPGAIVPAVVGGVTLLLALTGLSVLPYNATGLIFMLIAGACFVAEAYITSFGLLSLGGAASLVVGALLLFETPPELKDLKGLQVGVAPHVYGTTALLALLVAAGVGYLVTQAQLRRAVTGKEGLIGQEGVAITSVGPRGGRIMLRGEYWNARCEVQIEAGGRVRVDKVNGLTVEVSPVV